MTENTAGHIIAHGGEPPQASAFLRAVIEFARGKILERADKATSAQANQLRADVMALLE